jgi:hypothetical protein
MAGISPPPGHLPFGFGGSALRKTVERESRLIGLSGLAVPLRW